jgi:5'-3' exonuclease
VNSNTIEFVRNLCLSDPDINFYIAPHDSEEYIAKQILAKPDTLSLISSIDSDVLAFGIPHVVQYFGTVGENWFCLQDILTELNITLDQFRWMCVLLGNDFNDRLKGKGPVTILPVIRDPSFDLETWARKHNASDQWIFDAKRSYNIFSLI